MFKLDGEEYAKVLRLEELRFFLVGKEGYVFGVAERGVRVLYEMGEGKGLDLVSEGF